MTKPRLLKVYGSKVWQCRTHEFWGSGFSPSEAYTRWLAYMQRFHP